MRILQSFRTQPKLKKGWILIALAWLFSGVTLADEVGPFDGQSVSELQNRLDEINLQLADLAQYNPRSGVGTIGSRSDPRESAGQKESIEIDLGRECNIDQVVLVPTLLRDAIEGFQSDGFPIRFKVVVGSDGDSAGTTVASFDESDAIAPRIAPLVIAFEKMPASWVRIEADLLSSRKFDGRFILQFAEILVFEGQENVALGQPVKVSSGMTSSSPGWETDYAVDGFMSYLMNAAGGEESLAFVAQVEFDDQPIFTIDLGSSQPVSQINLHLVEQSDTVPQAHNGDFGIPRLLKIEGANQSDFSDAVTLVESEHRTIFDVGPIMVKRFETTECRYVRLTAIDPFVFSAESKLGARFGFAEIQVIANDKNVALGRKFEAEVQSYEPRTLAALTDNNNYYGRILTIRDWMNQLATRHDLESERPLIEAELNRRYQRQRAYLQGLGWLAGLLAFGVLGAIVIGWTLQQRAVTKTRERIAADLHDELGANFHAIGLLADLAQTNSKDPEKLNPLMVKIRELTDRTGTAANYCANMLESKGLYDDLVEEMRRTSDRLMADLDHDFSVEGEEYLASLSPRKRIDLYLFYKECLTNIIRHSSATKASTQLNAEPDVIRLKVSDNGGGLSDPQKNNVPGSVKRRAQLLGGTVSNVQPKDGGTCIELDFRPTNVGLASLLRIFR